MTRPEPKLPPDTEIASYLRGLKGEERRRALWRLGSDELDALDRDWRSFAHGGQLPPETAPGHDPWATWVLMAGRGFGKTLTGSKWIVDAVAAAAAAPARPGAPPLAIALVGATLDEARRIMIEGRSGLIEVADAWVREWNPSLRRLTFRTGATATLFSGASPEQLRGPEHHLAWCDELAKWEKPSETWDMLQLGLRLGDQPRVLVTTTPRPGPHLTRIIAEPGTILTHGTSWDNPHTSPAWKRANAARYAGTRLGRQELNGELLPDVPGALWSVELLESCRAQGRDCAAIARQRVEPASGGQPAARSGDRTDVTDSLRDGLAGPPQRRADDTPMSSGEGRSPARNAPASAGARPDEAPTCSGEGRSPAGNARACAGARPAPSAFAAFTKIVIGVDPPTGDGTCGIVACAKDAEGRAHVLADHSVTAATPERWSRAVAEAARLYSSPAFAGEGDRTKCGGGASSLPVTAVAEANQGGKMVKSVLQAADPNLRVKLVHAQVGKSERAAPIAMRFESGQITLHGRFPDLEPQLLGMIAGGGYEGPGDSPDRADAMVWALTELLLSREHPKPAVRRL